MKPEVGAEDDLREKQPLWIFGEGGVGIVAELAAFVGVAEEVPDDC